MLAALVWGCSSQPSLEEASKPGVEERTPGGVAKPIGPSGAPVKPGTGIGGQPIAPKPPAQAVSPLKDPASPLSKRSVFYDYDSDVIKEEYRPLIQAHAKYLAANAGAKMLIQGNCDERGSREYNIALGQRRADGLKRMLTLLGARENQVETVSLGEEKPRCPDLSETCYQQNRRSDMLYGGEF
jgi:peptidoglycan-associated lipoprotein